MQRQSLCELWSPLDQVSGRRGGPIVSTLDSRLSSPGSSPGWGHCVGFVGKTFYFYSHSASLHPGGCQQREMAYTLGLCFASHEFLFISL